MDRIERSPELMELARQALARQEAEKAKLAAMGPEDREAYLKAWRKRLAEEAASAGEYCDCCRPQEGKATK